MLEYNLFERLPSWSQVEVLNKTGTLVASRQHRDWHISLYLFQQRFVEVWSRGDLELVTSFHQEALPLAIFEPYTDQVKLSPLLDL